MRNRWDTTVFTCEEVLRAFTSHLNGEIIQNPYDRFLFSHRKTMLRSFCEPPAEIFPIFGGGNWWEVAMANRATTYSVKQTAMPGQTHCQNRRSRALGLLLLNPRWGKQNNLTHPKWLFTWPRRWMSTFDSRVKQPAWAPTGALACWMRLYSLLLPFHRSLKLFHCLSPGPKPKKETDKTKLWQERLRCCAMPVSEVGGDARVHIRRDLFEFAKWKGALYGDFPGSFPGR